MKARRKRSFDHEMDGVDHINIYSKGKTLLGRFLTNFSKTPIITEDGRFESVEGYWYWLGCPSPDRDKLRALSGFEAKKVGRDLDSPDWLSSEEFKRKIIEAIRVKISTYPKMREELKNSTLPLTHYYVYGDKVVPCPQADWIVDAIDEMRSMLS